ncbi:Holliday junction resolvase RuvX [Sandaracinus amylolyticus]|uniref:Holliday junction resolvase RuvX n=1 Tax=Sandaracinus amylolyticus TaxID=927083 RepID=UPI001F01D024|nr:Holliday junction resolvase RuvX [Sandaracinus amylolyticus]UJR80016.1 Holliday junction resolvase RuvX [Sandaracinus amylolyticus]
MASRARGWYTDARGRLRRLGIDPGTRRVGVAVADDEGMLASPRDTIEHVSDEATARAIAKVAEEEDAGEIVVGLPLGLDGREGPSSRHARSLARAIAKASGRRVVLWDERMTSQAAHRALAAGGASSRDRRGKVDRIAAALLLESYLEAQRAKAARARAKARDDEEP